MVATLLTAILVFWLAYDDATFGLVARNSVAIAVWWFIALTVGVGVLRVPRTRWFWTVGGFLAAFAGWTLASGGWGVDERAFNEFNRIMLYLGTFTLAALLAARASPGRWADGVALGSVGIAIVALGQRFFADLFPRGEYGRYITGPQLNYPIEYVNGLAIFLALSFPLLLRAAVASSTLVGRAVAIAPFPALVGAIYLTSSRGGVIVVAIGIVVFLGLSRRRWPAAGALAAAAAGSAGVVAVLLARPQLVDEPLTRAAEEQGPEAALFVALCCLGTAIVYAAGDRLLRGRSPAPALGWATVTAAVALAAAGVAAANPVATLETFRRAPTEAGATDPQYTVRGHLLSANSTGRWQYWQAAAEQFEEHPLIGNGAGSYEAWWARHGSLAIFITDAHSLYLETLGELGIIGLALLLAAFAVGGVAATRRALEESEPRRSGIAALAACFIAYAAAAAYDWMWELTVVSLVGLSALGWALCAGDVHGRRTLLLRLLLPAVAVLAIIAQAVPLASTLAIRDSQTAADRGDLGEAVSSAQAARQLQPWAASPYLQLALVFEETGRLPTARRAIRDAIERDRSNWRLWLVQARLQTKTGAIRSARRSLARAEILNPRSLLFSRS